MISVIIPTLNAQAGLEALLPQLMPHIDKIIVSDGGSTDKTLGVALRNNAQIAMGHAGRGPQLARAVTLVGDSEWILFLHADCVLGDGWQDAIKDHISRYPDTAAYFTLRYDSPKFAARIIEWVVRLRNWAWALPYGDQGLLISRTLYDEIGGFRPLPLFEDVNIVRRLGRSRLRRLRTDVITSAAKYERDGFFRRGWRNYRLLRRYLKGENAQALLSEYR